MMRETLLAMVLRHLDQGRGHIEKQQALIQHLKGMEELNT